MERDRLSRLLVPVKNRLRLVRSLRCTWAGTAAGLGASSLL
ncbi:hypothetical protein N6H14_33540 [Paenibacillus sp. CC-CFT747]|nr:hypothetical protein N6H14_33540 [Paenibacillus sp. CC-CFT747]